MAYPKPPRPTFSVLASFLAIGVSLLVALWLPYGQRSLAYLVCWWLFSSYALFLLLTDLLEWRELRRCHRAWVCATLLCALPGFIASSLWLLSHITWAL